MSDEVTFTMKEVTRYSLIRCLLEGKLLNEEVASALRLSVRQVKRIKKKVRLTGANGVIHGNTGRLPSHAFSPEIRQQVISLAEGRYSYFNFSHLSEMLAEEEGIRINRETLRQWLRPRGFGRKIRRMPNHRRKRPRCAREGTRLFLDGSPHPWFGEEETTLLLCTDDATGKPLYGLFQNEEDLVGCFRVCLQVFARHGLPGQFYIDRASQFTTTRHGGLHVTQRAEQPTQFERAMEELGIALIFANSPQARGRAERINGTFQDRLVAELKFRGINNMTNANRYLNHCFIPRYANRFGVEPREAIPAWRPLPPSLDIRNILCQRFHRTVNNDNTISVSGQSIQLLPTKNTPHIVRAKVSANLWLNGYWHIFHPVIGEIPCIPLMKTDTHLQNIATYPPQGG
jgi:transposase